MKRITDRQAEVLQSIIDHLEVNGFVPTIRELCTLIGISPKSVFGMKEHLKALEKKGFIRTIPYETRAITILRFPSGKRARFVIEEIDEEP